MEAVSLVFAALVATSSTSSHAVDWHEVYSAERTARVHWEAIADRRQVRVEEMHGLLVDRAHEIDRLKTAVASKPAPELREIDPWWVPWAIAGAAVGAAVLGAVGMRILDRSIP